MYRRFLVPVLAALTLAATTTAEAQWGGRDSRSSSGYGAYSDVRRIAYDRGYREGVTEGEKDGRSGDRYRYQDERDFQRADAGYHRSYGDRDRYRQYFRSGFMDGYSAGYRRYNRGGHGSYGGGYGTPGGGYGYGRDRYNLSPFDIGSRDGYEKGREDARENRAFDPRRHKWYREGDRDYDNRYGNRERYKDEYRRGFTAGYERGYRERRYR